MANSPNLLYNFPETILQHYIFILPCYIALFQMAGAEILLICQKTPAHFLILRHSLLLLPFQSPAQPLSILYMNIDGDKSFLPIISTHLPVGFQGAHNQIIACFQINLPIVRCKITPRAVYRVIRPAFN